MQKPFDSTNIRPVKVKHDCSRFAYRKSIVRSLSQSFNLKLSIHKEKLINFVRLECLASVIQAIKLGILVLGRKCQWFTPKGEISRDFSI